MNIRFAKKNKKSICGSDWSFLRGKKTECTQMFLLKDTMYDKLNIVESYAKSNSVYPILPNFLGLG